MNSQRKILAVGLFVLIAFLITITAVLKFQPTVGDGKQILSVRFSNLDKIAVGTRVTFAGQPIGDVLAIRTLQNARDQKVDRLGRIYFYELDLQLDSSIQVYTSDEISVYTTGLFGEKVINITPRPAQNGIIPTPLRKGEAVYVSSYDPLDETLQQVQQLGNKLSTIFDDFKDLLSADKGEFRTTLHKVHNSFALIEEALIQANQANLIPRLSDASRNFGGSMGLLEQQLQKASDAHLIENLATTIEATSMIAKALNQPEEIEALLASASHFFTGVDALQEKMNAEWPAVSQAIGDISAGATSARNAASDVELLTTGLKNGEGTIGKLLQREDVYLEVLSVATKASTLMNDLNQYGLLFHNNSTWKKQRAKRMADLEKISTPEQLMTFFETELDSISTALARMQQVVKENNNLPRTPNDPKRVEFQKAFRDLLNRLEYLEAATKSYNSEFLSP